MSQEPRAEQELLPSLLRPEVFTNPGAADWVATTPASRPVAPWIPVTGSAVGLLALVLAVTLVSHRQVYRYTGALVPGSLRCVPVQDPCSVDLQLAQPAMHRGDLAAGSTLDIAAAGQPVAQVRVLGRSLDPRDPVGAAPPIVRVSWPKAMPVPAGRIDIAGAQVHTLLGWIMPRDSGPLASGAVR